MPCMVVNSLHLVTHSFPNSSFSCVFNFSLHGIPPTSIYTRPSLFLLGTHLAASTPCLPSSLMLPYPFEKMVPKNCLHYHSSFFHSFQPGSCPQKGPRNCSLWSYQWLPWSLNPLSSHILSLGHIQYHSLSSSQYITISSSLLPAPPPHQSAYSFSGFFADLSFSVGSLNYWGVPEVHPGSPSLLSLYMIPQWWLTFP